jgi:hypothetical protein
LTANLATIRPPAIADRRMILQFDLPGCEGADIVHRWLTALREPGREAAGVSILEVTATASRSAARAVAPALRPFDLLIPTPDGTALLLGPTRRPGAWARRLGAAGDDLQLAVLGAWGLDEEPAICAAVAGRLGAAFRSIAA